MQQANKVVRGTVVGYRQVTIDASGTVGTVAGGATGGILGAQAGDTSVTEALGGVGGALAGGMIGNAFEHAVGKSTGWEYIVQEDKGLLVSVTQRQETPLPVGQHVLVIEGKQARIIPDYSIASTTPKSPPKTSSAPPAGTPTQTTASGAVTAASAPPMPSGTTANAAPTSIMPGGATPAAIPAAAFVSTAPSPGPSSSAPASSSDNSTAAATSKPAQ